MNYLIWSLPAIVVAAAIASGRITAVGAGALGAVVALVAGLLAGPHPYGPYEALESIGRGLWLSWTVLPFIIGGLFFWMMTAPKPVEGAEEKNIAHTPELDRQRMFLACLLIGPFAESATGFGIGMIATAAMLRPLNLGPTQRILLVLMSQVWGTWGGIASGLMIATALGRQDPEAMGVRSAVLALALVMVWLGMFWHLAKTSGYDAPRKRKQEEVVWVFASMLLMIPANKWLGPEISLLAAFGIVIIVHFLLVDKPDQERLQEAIRLAMPYLILIGSLVMLRSWPGLSAFLLNTLALQPFDRGPVWSPLLHPGSWLFIVGVGYAIKRGAVDSIWPALKKCTIDGKGSIYALVCFAIMAESLGLSGIARGLAQGLQLVFGGNVVIVTPTLAAAFALLTNSANAANGLFMQSQVALAHDMNLSPVWMAALHHVAAASFSMFSPVRITMACTMAGVSPNLARQGYAVAWPWMLAILVVCTILAALVWLFT